MKIILNGEPRQITDGLDVRDMLAAIDLDPEQKGIAVAVNAAVVPRGDWASTQISEGDQVDVIHAVQGG